MAFRETEAAPLRCYSSSSNTPYDDLFSNELCTSDNVLNVCGMKALSLEDLPVPQNGNGKVQLNQRVGAALKDIHVGMYVH